MTDSEAIITFVIGVAVLVFAFDRARTGKPKELLIAAMAAVIGFYIVKSSAGPVASVLAIPILVAAIFTVVILLLRQRRGRDQQADDGHD